MMTNGSINESLPGNSLWRSPLTLFLAVAGGLAATDGRAQVSSDSALGTLGGEVVDTAARPVRDADVILMLVQSYPPSRRFAPRSASTDAKGVFEFGNLPEGRFAVMVQRLGMTPWRDTVALAAGQTIRVDVRMAKDPSLRLWVEEQRLFNATWQPDLIFTDEDTEFDSCARGDEATVHLTADTIVVTGCRRFPVGFPFLRGQVARYGTTLILDVVPVSLPLVSQVVTARRYRARIIVPEPATYALHVRFNTLSRILESEVVTTRYVDLVGDSIYWNH